MADTWYDDGGGSEAALPLACHAWIARAACRLADATLRGRSPLACAAHLEPACRKYRRRILLTSLLEFFS